MCYSVACSCVIGFLTLLTHRHVCGETVLRTEGTRTLNELLTPNGSG